MEITALKPQEAPLLGALQPPDWSDILQKFEFYTGSDFCFPIKAAQDGSIAGVGTALVHQDVAWLAHIIVHPAYRNRGIGTTITQKLLAIARDRKCETIYLCATKLGARVYKKLGFETETEYLFFRNLNLGQGQTVSSRITSFKMEHRERIMAMDRAVTGENRTGTIADHISHAQVFDGENGVEGFYLPTLGEGTIIAATSTAGLELMKLRLRDNRDAVFPVNNTIATQFMVQQNCVAYRKEKRMRLGVERNVTFSNIYNRVAGKIG